MCRLLSARCSKFLTGSKLGLSLEVNEGEHPYTPSSVYNLVCKSCNQVGRVRITRKIIKVPII